MIKKLQINNAMVKIGIIILSLAFLSPIHQNPIPTFQVEIAALFGLLILCINFFIFKDNSILKKEEVSLPKIALMPFLLSILILIQIFIYNQFSSTILINTISLGYILCILLAVCIGFHLKNQTIDLPKYLSIALLITGLISTLIMIIQSKGEYFHKINIFTEKYLHIERIISIPAGETIRPYGNLNQPNHMITVMSWSVISWMYLITRKFNQISIKTKIVCFILGLFLSLGLVLPASRTLYLHCLVFLVINFLLYKSNKKAGIYIFVCISLGLITSLFGVIWAKDFFNLPIMTLIQRNSQTGIAENLRSILHAHGWLIFKQNPIIGASFGNFSWLQFMNVNDLPRGEIANSSHNILIDSLAKLGIVGTLLLIFPLLIWTFATFKHALKNENKLYFILSLGIVGCLFAHSMLEYPQNYLFFLIPAFLLVGFSETKKIKLLPQNKLLLGCIMLIVSIYAGIMCKDFPMITYIKKDVYPIVLYPYADLNSTYALTTKDFDKTLSSIHEKIAENAIHLSTSPGAMQNYILLLAYKGEKEKALDYTKRILNFVNTEPKEYINNLFLKSQESTLRHHKNAQEFAYALKKQYPDFINTKIKHE